jgi:hypothetical protein
MKEERFGVAYIYQEVPKYDRADYIAGTYHFYEGGKEVLVIDRLEESCTFFPPTRLGLDFFIAADEKDAIRKLMDSFPFHIVTALALKVSYHT